MENTMHTKEVALSMLAGLFSFTMTPETAMGYSAALSPYHDEEVYAACLGYLTDSIRPQWMPSPGEIAKRIEDARGKERVRALRQKIARDTAEGWDGYLAEIRLRDLREWKAMGTVSHERLTYLYLDECVRPSQRRDAIEQAFKAGKLSQADRDALVKRLDAALANLRAAGKCIVEGPFAPFALAPVK